METVETKEEKLVRLRETGLIDNVEDFKNLKSSQIDFLVERIVSLKRVELSEEEIDRLVKSELIDGVTRNQLNTEVIKRRTAEQKWNSLKAQARGKLDELVQIFK